MSTYTTSPADIRCNDNTRFRAQGLWMSQQLDNLWPKTGDTGQIDWATVTAPTGADDYRGYEIRTSNDGLKTVYLKIEYGSGYGAYAWALRFTLGSGSNGSGTLTGATAAVRMRTAMTYAGGSVMPGTIAISGTTGRLSFSLSETRPGADTYFSYTEYWGGVAVIQRYTDASGADTSNGVVVWTMSEDSVQGRTIMAGLDWYTTEYPLTFVSGLDAAGPGCSFYVKAMKGSASYIPVYPFGVQTSQGLMLMRDIAFVPRSLQTYLTTGSFSRMGSTLTYINGFANVTAAAVFGVAQPVAMAVMVRYE